MSSIFQTFNDFSSPCEIRIRPGDTVLSVLQRLRELNISEPFRYVKELQLCPEQLIILPCSFPGPIPATGCRQLLEAAFAAVKTTDTKIQASEIAIGIARLRPSGRLPINGFHQSIVRVPVLIIGNDRFVNPFTGKNVPGANLMRLSPDNWELVEPVLGDPVQRNISLFDLTSVAAFISQDSNFKTDCPSNLSVQYNSRCLGLLEALDSIDGLGVLPPSYMAFPDSVYIRKRLLPDAVIPDWIETIGGSILPKVVGGVVVEKIVIVPALSLHDYLRNIGARTCVPNSLLEAEVQVQEEIVLPPRGELDREIGIGQTLNFDRIIGNLGNGPTSVAERIAVDEATLNRGSTGLPPIDRQGYYNNLYNPYINPTRFNTTDRYLQTGTIDGQVCRTDPFTGAFKCWRPV
jgi:hypothetical protein